MGGRGNAGNTKMFSNIDASRNAPLRATRAKEIAASSKGPKAISAGSFKGFRNAGDSIVRGAPVLLSQKTLRQAIDLPDAMQGHIGSPERRASQVASAFNEGLSKQRSAGKKPTESFGFKVEMQTSYRTRATFNFKGRMVRDPASKKLVAGTVNLVRVER